MAILKRRRAVTSPIDTANKKSDAEFVKDYLELEVPNTIPWKTSWTRPGTSEVYSIRLARPANLDEATLEACYTLIETTSRGDYEASKLRWRPDHKRQEMRLPDLRYIIVRRVGHGGSVSETQEVNQADEATNESDNSNSGNNGTIDTDQTAASAEDVCAFTSLMPTYEEGHAVVYCYEIHVSPSLQGSGLGRVLLGFQSIVAHNLGPPVEKVMLTCFLSNERALRFYKHEGFMTDASAPTTRRLRRGKTFVPDYTILSKAVER
ncbi:GNAT family acetyltransferase Nat4 [Sporothrix schenckii 1099-18]|uniref:N-alpha-acetyltransferase 40 n=2 Tax=Sporothrix schenckii TaxID=29908 RepID=U7PSB0_SPOS1|nr:GNAT family acetyltransferase Nat4 [Sporothrix schenckii 1099-18]ERS98467.1 hypothetical protein HMPREF1624_05251 [Sporothrix schenckii ATCC 58251]KJR89383.1 GNAT family acetyltransferase Nat4 [Sporothrix schenckii 1099-18]